MEGHPLGEEKEQGQPEAGPSSSTLRLQAQTQLASRDCHRPGGSHRVPHPVPVPLLAAGTPGMCPAGLGRCSTYYIKHLDFMD